jgi:hypothetical protein
MYPNQLDPATKSDAERTLYAALRDQLDDTYTVFHSVAYLAPSQRKRAPFDGEIDFVLAHPLYGILILEVKGGGIRHDPETGQWTSISHNGAEWKIGDPFMQARGSMHALLGRLVSMTNLPRKRIDIGYGIAFPDAAAETEWFDPDRPREIVLDQQDLDTLSIWVKGALDYWRGGRAREDAAPGEQLQEALLDLLGKAWELRPVIWRRLVQEQETLIRLTEQQYALLDALNRRRRAAICGCAGSGKTMLALEKAVRLAKQGFRVLLTCFNKHLAADLRTQAGRQENLEIVHFHGLCLDWARQAGWRPAGPGNAAFYDRLLPQALQAAARALDRRYDAIIVDEGQDFRPNWWMPLQSLLEDPEQDILYVFYDDNQRLYAQQSGFPIQDDPYLLTVNCRNTQHIHQVVTNFYQAGDSAAGAEPSALGPLGRPVEIVPYDLNYPLTEALHATLIRLIDLEDVPAHEIVVLTPLRTKSKLTNTAFPDTPLSDTWPPPKNHVYWTTIQDFKGLEAAVVILSELEGWLAGRVDLGPLLYVGCSRARTHLAVLLPKSADPEVRSAFAVARERSVDRSGSTQSAREVERQVKSLSRVRKHALLEHKPGILALARRRV